MRTIECPQDLSSVYKASVDYHELGIENNVRYNEYFLLSNDSQTLPVYKNNDNQICMAKLPKSLPISTKFFEHTVATHALLYNDDLKLVVLQGASGGGKSYMSLACGLYSILKSDQKSYKKILLIRNNVPASSYTLGLLPGGLSDKMGPWFGPSDDILEELLSTPGFRGLAGKMDGDLPPSQMLMANGILDLCTPEFMRGASKHDCYVIIDDFQNFTKNECDLLLTRFGRGSKIVVCGDPLQVDNKQTNGTNSGLKMLTDMIYSDETLSQMSTVINFCHSECRSPWVKAYCEARAKYNTNK